MARNVSRETATKYKLEVTVQSALGAVGSEVVTLHSAEWGFHEDALRWAGPLVRTLIGDKPRSRRSWERWSAEVIGDMETPSAGWGTWNEQGSAYISVTVDRIEAA